MRGWKDGRERDWSIDKLESKMIDEDGDNQGGVEGGSVQFS